MSNIVKLYGGGCSNIPELPNSELINAAKDANMALVVKIIDACDNDTRLRSRIFTQTHTSAISWSGKLSMLLSIFYISKF